MINPNALYPGKTAAPSVNYPFGGPRDVAIPGDGTGTPWTAAVLGDLWGWIQGLLSRAGLTPSGTSDTATASQIFDASGAWHGFTLALTTDALAYDLAGVSVFETRDYGVAGDAGGARWVSTGNIIGGSAGTINWLTGFLYDANGREFSHASAEITFEAFDHQYASAVTYQTASGKPIHLQPGGVYALGGTALHFGTGATVRGPVLGDTTAAAMPKFTYTGAGNALVTDAGGAPREDILFENFRIEALSGGGCLWVNNTRRAVINQLVFTASGSYMATFGAGENIVVAACKWEKVSGVNNTAAFFGGTIGAILRDPIFVNPLSQDWTPIEIGSGTVGTLISGVVYAGAGTVAPIVDAGERTVYLDGIWHRSESFDLTGSGAYRLAGIHRGGWVNRIQVVYDGALATSGVAVLQVGKASGSPGAISGSYFWSGGTTVGAHWELEDIAPAGWAASDLPDGDILTFYFGGGLVAGACHIVVEVLPYRGRK